ncbi:hypothetical protein [Streptomyces sp. NPDC049040]|uniref:hypothetical protein n=1 Tax=Streptomyces sp. NPDC049040 TaxID=3365593 RepID=UPI0037236E95
MPYDEDPRLAFGRTRGGRDEPEERAWFPPQPSGTGGTDGTTMRLGAPRPSPEEVTRATMLDPDAWPTDVGAARQHPAPAPATGWPTAAAWHGTTATGERAVAVRPRRRRALRGWLLPVVVLTAVLAYLGWQRLGGTVKVAGVGVRSTATQVGCHTTARIVGTLRTTGGAGTVGYRWRRSDGTVSDVVRQHVAKGNRQTDVVLLWALDGPGSYTATATLEVLTPQQWSVSATFRYRCR